MPLTTVDIPKELIEYLDGLVARGLKHSRKEAILEALSFYRALGMDSWRAPVYQLAGARVVIVDCEGLAKLVELASRAGAEGLKEVGRAAGRMLRDRLTASGLLPSPLSPAGWEAVFGLLTSLGWGRFRLADGKVVAVQLAVPPALVEGYLEGLLGVGLRPEPTAASDVAVFEVVGGAP